MNYEDLTPEQIEKAKTCKTPEEILALAKQEGYELSDEQLEQIAGGDTWGEINAFISCCPYCGSNQLEFVEKNGDKRIYRCKSCHLCCT